MARAMKTQWGALALAAVSATAPAQSVVTFTENTSGSGQVALGFPPPLPVESLTPVAGFRTYASLIARAQQLDLLASEVTEHVIGSSFVSRTVYAYTLSDADTTTAHGDPEPAVMIVAGIHAREWANTETVMGILESITAARADGALNQYLVENLNIVVVPALNPDGILQTQRFPNQVVLSGSYSDGRLRRKSMRGADEVLTTFSDRLRGVDLNRNHPVGFGQNGGSSNSLDSDLYRGTAPQSEPESQALALAGETLGPGSRLRFYIDFHSYQKAYIQPSTGNARRDAITTTLALRQIAAIGTTRGSQYSLAPFDPGEEIGATDDYFAYTYQIPSWTLEIEPPFDGAYGNPVSSSGFILPAAEIERVRTDLLRATRLGFYLQAGPPVVRRVIVRDAESGAVAFDAEWQRSDATTRVLASSTATGLVPGRSYRLWVAFNKPMRWRDSGGAVVNYPGMTVTLAASASLSGDDAGGVPFTASVNATAQSWQRTVGTTPGSGALRYGDDAFEGTFSIPAGFAASASTALRLSLGAADMGNQALDARPQTIVDWENGAWARYEDTAGTAGDAGGTDATIVIPVRAAATGGGWLIR